MSIGSHSLIDELPEYRERIHALKSESTHFSRLFDHYDEVDHALRRIYSGAEVASDMRFEELKKKRLKLKDELFTLLKLAYR